MRIGQSTYPCKYNRTQVIDIITTLCTNRSNEYRRGGNSTQKGKRGDLISREYFINIFEKCKLWIIIYPKFLRLGNESPSG
jgi:hypothetical protein